MSTMKNDEPMTLDRLIGILQGLRPTVGGGALVHTVVDDEDEYGVPIPYDIVDVGTQLHDDCPNAVRLLACQI